MTTSSMAATRHLGDDRPAVVPVSSRHEGTDLALRVDQLIARLEAKVLSRSMWSLSVDGQRPVHGSSDEDAGRSECEIPTRCG